MDEKHQWQTVYVKIEMLKLLITLGVLTRRHLTTDRKEARLLVRQMAGEIIFQTKRATKCKEHKFKVPKVSMCLVCFCLLREHGQDNVISY